MRRYLRFSIATLLVLMTIVAAFFGGYRYGYRAAEGRLRAPSPPVTGTRDEAVP
ncbi:MAG: hypothetical protein U0836_08455 [Pirellulales bacterium]